MNEIEVMDEVLKTILDIDTLDTIHDLELVLALYEEMKKDLFNRAGDQDSVHKETLMDFAKVLNAKILIIKNHLSKKKEDSIKKA